MKKQVKADFFDMKIHSLKGLGRVRTALMEKLDIHSVYDLLCHYPLRYEDRTKQKMIAQATHDEVCTIHAQVRSAVSQRISKKGIVVISATAEDETGAIELIWFNQQYIKTRINSGNKYYFYGKVRISTYQVQMQNPLIIDEQNKETEAVIMPVYSTVARLSQYYIRKAVKQSLAYVYSIEDVLPPSLCEHYQLMEKSRALLNIHFPKTEVDLMQARKRLVFEELLVFQLALLSMRRQNEQTQSIRFSQKKEVDIFASELPFALTDAQVRVYREIYTDMTAPICMNRLMQGDVGSGKTVVALMAMLLAVYNGYQAAMMAPTEILAYQHLQTIQSMLHDRAVNTCVLTSGTPNKEAESLLKQIEKGDIHIIIGTHAIIEEKVRYHRLGLVITDEQHRFGVRQRARFTKKGAHPDQLVMTATPIPRTLAMILYGDLDISVIDEMPVGRKTVQTYTVHENMRRRIDLFIEKQIQSGRQIYIICPLVEDSEHIEAASAEKTIEIVAKKFSKYRVAIIHGRMKSQEKDAIMKHFKSGHIDILISTTVVEVGVDVPNANVMVIENAERFGLSTLHQLRGRVGRGTEQAYCILFNQSGSPIAKKRLDVMVQSNDGFYISEQDLKLRGPGDFFGTRQHGLPALKIANLYTDTAVLQQAQACARIIIEKQGLKRKEYSLLKARIDQLCTKYFGGQL